MTTTTSTIPRPATTTVPCGTARCTLDTALQSPECAGQAVPRNITTKLDQATQLIEQARNSGAKKAKRLLKHAKTTLNVAVKAADKASRGRPPKLTAACAASLRRAADGVQGGLGV